MNSLKKPGTARRRIRVGGRALFRGHPIGFWLLVLAFASPAPGAGFAPGSAHDRGDAKSDLLTAFLAADEHLGLGSAESSIDAKLAFQRRLDSLPHHESGISGSAEVATILHAGLASSTSSARPPSGSVGWSTFTEAVRSGKGSCAALTATVLALAEPFDSPFDAIILRDHVVLGLRGTKGVYFETLEGGRLIGDLELRRHKLPSSGRPIRVDAEGFLPYYLDNLAARLAEAGRRDDAERALTHGLSLAPKAGRLHYNLGTLLLDSPRFAEAEGHLKLAIRYGWDDADAWVNRGVALWKLGKTAKAADCFEAALKEDPKNSRALSNREALRREAGPTHSPGR